MSPLSQYIAVIISLLWAFFALPRSISGSNGLFGPLKHHFTINKEREVRLIRSSLTLRRIALFFALCLLPLLARGATVDPDTHWRTIRTVHFVLHFHQGLEGIASEMSTVSESIFTDVSQELDWIPKERIHVLIMDPTDQANGSASALPRKLITLYVTAPDAGSSLGYYENWNRTLFTHELTHVLHLDTHRGIISLARHFVGPIASSQQLSPRWIVEGLGTFEETRLAPGGRGEAPLAQMILRTAVIEDRFPRLGQLDGYQIAPPAGQIRYLFGESFVHYLSDQHGADSWTRWNHAYGGRLPFFFPTRAIFGARFPKLYSDWREHLTQTSLSQVKQIEADGLVEGEQIPTHLASCTSPTYSPDGDQLIWSCSDPREGSSVWLARSDGSNAKRLLSNRGANAISWRADSKAIVYSSSQQVNRFNVYSDLYLFTFGDRRPRLLTAGARAKDPDYTVDGGAIVVVTEHAQHTRLQDVTLDGRLRALTPKANTPAERVQFSRPRVSPNGQLIAVSAHRGGQSDLWLYTRSGQPIKNLTNDLAPDRDPEWSPDGDWLYFSSDRTGVPNLFAIHLKTETLYQVTNVRTGATRPAIHPSGETLAFQLYAQHGWTIHTLTLNPSHFLPLGPLNSAVFTGSKFKTDSSDQVLPSRHPHAGTGGLIQGRTALRSGGATSFDLITVDDPYAQPDKVHFPIPPRPYRAWRGLAPTFLLPSLQLSPFPSRGAFSFLGPVSGVARLSTSMSDPLRYLAYSADLTYRTDLNQPGGGLSFSVNRFMAVLSAGARQRFVFRGAVPLTDPNGQPIKRCGPPAYQDCYFERQRLLWASISYPYTSKTTLFGSYQLSFRESLYALPDSTSISALPVQGRIGSLSVGWRYAWSKQSPAAISVEDGRLASVIVSAIHPRLGTQVHSATPLSRVQLVGDFRNYWELPRHPNTVLATRVEGGFSAGDSAKLGTYQLGGHLELSPYYASPKGMRMLRGFAIGTQSGDLYWLSSVEFRFPITRIDSGYSTFPVFLRALSGALFLDAGEAGDIGASASELFQSPLIGAGVELKLSSVVSYGLNTSATIGLARGLTGPLSGVPFSEQLYFRLGGSF